jgi:peptidoglycan/xylan/chitin deacetylase (PgdA/CDA1 family)
MRPSVLLPLAAHVPGVARAYGIPCRLPRADAAALTFDDGPHPEGTPAVLDALDAATATATFFLVGEQVERRPELAREIAARGHAVALHGYRHRLVLRRTRRALADDLDRAAALITEAAGVPPLYYRAPYGVFSGASLALARQRGWVPFLWSRWGRDWERRATEGTIARRAASRLAGGDVVLLHDADHYSSAGSWRSTVEALPAILEAGSSLGVSWIPLTHAT